MTWILKIDNLSKVYKTGSKVTANGTLYEYVKKRALNLVGVTPKDQSLLEPENASSVITHKQTEGLPDGMFWALKDINLEIQPGERIGLIGKNGSGKSTLLKIISRITAPTYGEYRYRGHLISLLEVGTGFHPELTGRDNIYLNAAINGMSKSQIDMRLNDILEFSELGKQIETPIKRYSSGMYMRLAFSVAAFLESEILLVDEVLAVGDNDFQAKCKEKMIELANDGRTVIFVSHDMNSVNSICKKTVEMQYGRVVAIRDVIQQETPKHPIQNISTRNPEQTEPKIPSPLKNQIKLKTAKFTDSNGNEKKKFSKNEELILHIGYLITEYTEFNIVITVSSSEGQKLFSSKKLKKINLQSILPDNLVEQLHFPENLFVNDLYQLEINIMDLSGHVIDSSLIKLEFDKQNENIAIEQMTHAYPLQLKLKWNLNKKQFDSSTNVLEFNA